MGEVTEDDREAESVMAALGAPCRRCLICLQETGNFMFRQDTYLGLVYGVCGGCVRRVRERHAGMHVDEVVLALRGMIQADRGGDLTKVSTSQMHYEAIDFRWRNHHFSRTARGNP